MLLTHDDTMGPSDAPGQLQKYTQPEVTEKYKKLKRRYNQLDEKHNELLDELQRASERNLKMREERNILLDRIIELENGSKLPPGTAPQATQSAFPRALVKQRSQAAFIANLTRAEAELGMEIDGSDIRETSRHLSAIAEANHRADIDKQLAWEEELEREARREAKRKARANESNGRRLRIGWHPHEDVESPLTPREEWIASNHSRMDTRMDYDSSIAGAREAARRSSIPGPSEFNGERGRLGWYTHDAERRLDKSGMDVTMGRERGPSRTPSMSGPGPSDLFGRRQRIERYPYEGDGLPSTTHREEFTGNGYSRLGLDSAHIGERMSSPARSVPGPDITPPVDPNIDPSLMTAVMPRSTTPPGSPRYSARFNPPHAPSSVASYSHPIPTPVPFGGPAPVAYSPMIHYEPTNPSSSKMRQPPLPPPPPPPEEPKGPKQKRARTQAAVSKPISIPVIPRDSNLRPLLPLTVGMLTLISLGEVCARDHFHTERYIYPIGYEVTKRYQSTIDPRSEVLYHCSIHDGEDGPRFQIIPADRPDEPVLAGTATGAWSSIVKQANAIRNRNHSNSVSGPEFFGLGQNTIRHLIQDLPGARELRDYARQVFVEGGQMGTSYDPYKLSSASELTRERLQPYVPVRLQDRPPMTPSPSTASNHTSHSSYHHDRTRFYNTSPQPITQSSIPPHRPISNPTPQPLHIQQYWPSGVSPPSQPPPEKTSRLSKPLTFVTPLQPS